MGELFKSSGLGGDAVFGRAKGATSDSEYFAWADSGFVASVTFEILFPLALLKKK